MIRDCFHRLYMYLQRILLADTPYLFFMNCSTFVGLLLATDGGHTRRLTIPSLQLVDR